MKNDLLKVIFVVKWSECQYRISINKVPKYTFFNDGEFWYVKRPYLSNTKTCTINLKTMAKTLNDLNGTMLDKSQPIVVMLPEIEKYVCKCISEL